MARIDAVGNSRAAMPTASGKRPISGANPIAAMFHRASRRSDAVMVDLPLSQAARGKIMAAAKKRESMPPDRALDQNGRPTTDAETAPAGSKLPAGGTKGTRLARVVEPLMMAPTGARFGAQADSSFEEQGRPPRIGHAFIVVDPAAPAGTEVHGARIEAPLREAATDGLEVIEPAVALLPAPCGQTG